MGNLSISEEDCGIESPTILWASLVAQTVSGSEDLGSIPVSGRSPGEGIGYPLQYSYLRNLRQRSVEGYSPWGSQRVGHD